MECVQSVSYTHLVNAVNKAVKSTDYHCENTSGESLDYLMQKYVSTTIPLLIWVTTNMREPNKGDSWYLENGEVFVWTAGEHCMVLVGEEDVYKRQAFLSAVTVN